MFLNSFPTAEALASSAAILSFLGESVMNSPAGINEREKEKRFWRRKVLLSLVFSVPVFFLSMVFGNIPGAIRHGLNTSTGGFTVNELVQWILTTPVQVSDHHPPIGDSSIPIWLLHLLHVDRQATACASSRQRPSCPCMQFIVGWHFHANAVRVLRRGSANMDVLVSLGTNAAYTYSVISVFHRRSLYLRGIEVDSMGFFETSALLITFISLGKFLEAHAKGRTSQARELWRTPALPAALTCRCWEAFRKPLR